LFAESSRAVESSSDRRNSPGLVTRRELKLILEKYVLPGPAISLVHPSAGHQSPKVQAGKP